MSSEADQDNKERILMENTNLVEEYPREYDKTQFEKILVAAKRAKDIHNSRKTPLIDSDRKPPYVALEEMKANLINTIYRKEEPVELVAEESEEEE